MFCAERSCVKSRDSPPLFWCIFDFLSGSNPPHTKRPPIPLQRRWTITSALGCCYKKHIKWTDENADKKKNRGNMQIWKMETPLWNTNGTDLSNSTLQVIFDECIFHVCFVYAVFFYSRINEGKFNIIMLKLILALNQQNNWQREKTTTTSSLNKENNVI